jgi:hypothetical protein
MQNARYPRRKIERYNRPENKIGLPTDKFPTCPSRSLTACPDALKPLYRDRSARYQKRTERNRGEPQFSSLPVQGGVARSDEVVTARGIEK